ncbi:MAG: hypothetical protein PHW25_09110 [Zoogloea sp.]|uniref:hypothetical protein n=1 Tax=Zoogloea sp. TaxID=49181 RepID=UPI0026132121|nr:hypothetical protein [Zoogloea sp.]MDD3327226.1 hypothetical protein [Zoogloea sp.]
MKADRYLAFSSAEGAKAFLEQLHAAMQHREVWAEPNVHPFEDRAVIPWNDGYLAQYRHLLQGVEHISLEEALEQGFTFGRLKGPFAHARAKLEEAQLLQEALTAATSLPNFPVYRALFFGFLSATYALKEALKESCKRLGSHPKTWFEEQFQRLKADPLVWAFYRMNNDNKHQPDDLPLRSYLQVRAFRVSGGPQGVRVVMSNEGILGIVHEGTGRERVVALAGSADVNWQVVIEMPDYGIGGPATPLAEQVLRFYEILVFEARRTYGGEPGLRA